MESGGWHSAVYHPSNQLLDNTVYQETFKEFCRKNAWRCESCRRKFGKHGLSLHHIIPLADGGADEPENMALVCKECHDRIEENPLKYRTRHAICRAFLPDTPKRKPVNVGYGRDWHQWVYGGMRNPHNG